MKLKVFFPLLFSSVVFTVTTTVTACSDYQCESEVHLFDPAIINDTAAASLFRDECYPYFQFDENFANKNTTYNNVNIEEWNRYFNHSIPDASLSFIVYQASISQIDSAILIVKKKGTFSSSSSEFQALLVSPDRTKTKDFLFYIGFARRCEKWVTSSSGWENQNVKDSATARTEIKKLIDAATNQLSNIKNNFLYERYIYQIIRLFFASWKYNECIDFYNRYSAKFTESPSIKYRSIGYAAASYYRLKNFAASNYYYALLFQKFPQYKKTAVFSFHPQSGAEWEQTLKLADNSTIKETMWFINGLYGNVLNSMTNIYSLNHHSTYLPLLCTRAINIEEERIAYLPDSAFTPNTDLIKAVTTIALENNQADQCVWNLSAAHLYAYIGNPDSVAKYLDKTGAFVRKNQRLKKQLKVTRFILYLKTPHNLDNEFISAINNFYTHFSSDTTDSSNITYNVARQWGRVQLSRIYSSNGDSAIAQLFLPRVDFFNENDNIEALIKIMQKGTKAPAKAFVNNGKVEYDFETLRAMEGMNELRKFHFQEAIRFFKLSGKYGTDTCKNPFSAYMNDWHTTTTPLSNDNDSPMTKIAITQKAWRYYTLSKQKNAGCAEAFYRMANFRFNIFTYGVSNGFINPCSSKSCMEFAQLPTIVASYLDSALAKKPSPELKARIYAMKAKYELYLSNNYVGRLKEILSNSGYKKLKEECSKTEFYKEMIRDCGYFRKFLGIKKPASEG